MSPVDIFELFFDKNLLEWIVKQTVIYACQKGNFGFKFSVDELKTFIRILILSGYYAMPQWRMHWEEQDDCHNTRTLISNNMRRNWFDVIMQYLHFNDNTEINESVTDRLFKVRPYLDKLWNSFLKYAIWSPTSSIDESMIRYFGRNCLKQHIANKPIQFGYKVWSHSFWDGYLIDFEIYQGRKGAPNIYSQDFGVGSVILRFFENLLSDCF